MRIGLFSDTYAPDINGVVSSIVTLQHALEALGHEVFVIANQPRLFKRGYDGKILRLSGLELKWMYGYTMTSPFQPSAVKTIRAMNLDIIHAHTEFGVGIYARSVAKKLNLPLVSTYHTTYEDYTHYINPLHVKTVERTLRKMVARLSKYFSERGHAVIAPSAKTKTMLEGYGITCPIYVIPTGLDLKRFDKRASSPQAIQALRESMGFSEDTFVILFVGRLAEEKAIDLVIQGFSHVDRVALKAKLVIVGGGPDDHRLQSLAKSLNLDEDVIFTGKKPSAEVPLYYHSADAFVSASLTETQGMTFIEAMAAECPLFARPDDVLSELVIEDRTGYYFTTPEGFAEKVAHHLRKSVAERNAMKKAARAQVQVYDDREFGKVVAEVYQKTVDDYKTHP